MQRKLFEAIAGGDLATVEQVLKTDARLAGSRNEKGLSAVMMATYYRRPEIAAALVATGVELDVFEAAATGRTDRVRDLIREVADRVNAYAADGFFPLALAVFFGRAETVEVLLAAGADPNQVSRESMRVTPIQSAAAARRADIARRLVAHGANVNVVLGENGQSPLHEAALLGDLEMVNVLADGGAALDARTRDGRTALAIARAGGHAAVVEALERRGARE